MPKGNIEVPAKILPRLLHGGKQRPQVFGAGIHIEGGPADHQTVQGAEHGIAEHVQGQVKGLLLLRFRQVPGQLGPQNAAGKPVQLFPPQGRGELPQQGLLGPQKRQGLTAPLLRVHSFVILQRHTELALHDPLQYAVNS